MRSGIVHLICWTTSPTTVEDLNKILPQLTIDELVHAATAVRGTTGRIAWVELARRFGYFDFKVGVTHGVGGLKLEYEAAAAPVHELPQYC